MPDEFFIVLTILAGLYAIVLLIIPFVILRISNTAQRSEDNLKRVVKLLEHQETIKSRLGRIVTLLEYQEKVMKQHDKEE